MAQAQVYRPRGLGNMGPARLIEVAEDLLGKRFKWVADAKAALEKLPSPGGTSSKPVKKARHVEDEAPKHKAKAKPEKAKAKVKTKRMGDLV